MTTKNMAKQKTGSTRPTKNSTNSQKQSSSVINVVVKDPQPKVQQQNQGRTLRLRQKELIAKFSGVERKWALCLAPGRTGAKRLDQLARQHAWARWEASPKVTFRSLCPANTDGTYSYLVVHDLEEAKLSQAIYWDETSRQYTSNLATTSFTHSIPVQVLNPRTVSRGTDHFSWFLLKYAGKSVAPGELWLEYDVSFGGVADDSQPPQYFQVKNGVFFDPTDSTTPLPGLPVAGQRTSYTFMGDKPLTRSQADDFVKLTDATPHQVVRPSTNDPTVKPTSPVRELGLGFAEGLINKATKVFGKKLGGRGTLLTKPLAFVSTLLGRDTTLDPTKFASWSGEVMVRPLIDSWDDYSSYQTLPPVPEFELATEPEETSLPMVARVGKRSESRSGLVGKLLQGVLQVILDPVGPLALVIEKILTESVKKDAIVHRAGHAVQFFRNLDLTLVDKEPESGLDQGGENPNLPEIPDFGGDLEAPGTDVEWAANQRTMQGYLIDNNGTPLLKYLSTTSSTTTHFSPPTPVYYYNMKRPWDQETKRLPAFKLTASQLLAKHYLLLECYNWGDDGCGSWVNNIPGTRYLGTVARFSGISCSRSVLYLEDYAQFNAAAEHFVIGQGKDKYMKTDEGRASLFLIKLGAVGDYGVATNYLANWLVDSSITRMQNHYKNKNGSEGTGKIAVHADFQYSRAALVANPNLDPSSPGFAENYQAYKSGTRATLPWVLEAGPFRMVNLARYDDANGWWQHVPDASWTETDISAYWRVYYRLNGEESGSWKDLPAGHANFRKRACLCSITPPSQLVTGAYACIEIISIAGSESSCATDALLSSSDSNTSALRKLMVPGPITLRRIVYKLSSDSKIDFWDVGDTSRPTTGVESASGDIYVMNHINMYLVKNADVATRWCFDKTSDHDVSSFGNGNYGKNIYAVQPGAVGTPWTIGAKSELIADTWLSDKAPCKTWDGNKCWQPGGYKESVVRELVTEERAEDETQDGHSPADDCNEPSREGLGNQDTTIRDPSDGQSNSTAHTQTGGSAAE